MFDTHLLEEVPGCEAPLERVETALSEGAAHLAAATCRWLVHLAEFDRREGWASWGCRSAAHWLTFRCGVDLATAREQVKVAARLRELPRILEAFSRGELSWWQVRQLVRVATPETDQTLLDLARSATATQLASIVGGLARTLALEADLHPRRRFGWWVDEDGFVNFSGRLAPEEGTLVAKALDAIVDDLFRAKRESVTNAKAPVPDQPHDTTGDADDPVAATRADALVRMARLALAATTNEIADRAQVVVHVDRSVLASATSHADETCRPAAEPPDDGHLNGPPETGDRHADGNHLYGRCELEGGPPIPVDTALRLACDAALIALVEDQGGIPLNLGRRTRSIPPALRRALRARDGGCRFPGCPEARFVEGHHLRHWARGGPTNLSNLAEMCRFHHRLVHEGGWRIEGTPGNLRFIRPDGVPIAARAGP